MKAHNSLNYELLFSHFIPQVAPRFIPLNNFINNWRWIPNLLLLTFDLEIQPRWHSDTHLIFACILYLNQFSFPMYKLIIGLAARDATQISCWGEATVRASESVSSAWRFTSSWSKNIPWFKGHWKYKIHWAGPFVSLALKTFKWFLKSPLPVRMKYKITFFQWMPLMQCEWVYSF